MESFWGTLKNELVYHQDYKTRFTAISDITQYIELYYNQMRIQKDLGYRSPTQQASKKWSMPIRNWTAALNRFMIMFDERISRHLI